MEPLVGEGDRLIVDISRRVPATGEMAVLWDGLGLVVKRVEDVSGSDPAELRVISADPAYEPYAVSSHDVHMVGKVVWVLREGVRRSIHGDHARHSRRNQAPDRSRA